MGYSKTKKTFTFIFSIRASLKDISALFISLLSFACISLFAQNATQNKVDQNDSKLLNGYIQSRGLSGTIVFDNINIKQYWIENFVCNDDDSIKISLDTNKKPLRIQLMNIDESYDCNVLVIAETPDFSFNVLNHRLSPIGTSAKEDDFIHYNVASSTFHLEDTNALCFYLDFSAKSASVLSIKKIVLSFSKNNNSKFLSSPGKIIISDNNSTISTGGSISHDENSLLVLTGTGSEMSFTSNNLVLSTDNSLTLSLKVKNIGDTSSDLYVGFIPYTKEMKQITSRVAPFENNNTILKVFSTEKDSDKIIVETFPERWKKNCYLVLNAKDDLSDFPDFDFLPGAILDIQKTNDGHAVIQLSAPLKAPIEKGTKLRVHSPYGSRYLYVGHKTLQPGETFDCVSTIQKDNSFYGYSSKAFCKGTYCVRPVLISFPGDKQKEQIIQVLDFSLNY